MPNSALVEKLHTEIAVSCETTGCHEVFISGELPSEPVELWSARSAVGAERLGWSVSSAGMVLCPKHGGPA